MIQKINEWDFIDAFRGGIYKDNFSYSGLKALFDYLEEIEDEENPTEFDIVAIACEYTEYADLEELRANYSDIESIDELEEKTTVIKIGDGDSFIIADY